MLFGERESRCTKCRLGWKTAFLVIFRFCQKAIKTGFSNQIYTWYTYFLSLQKHYEHIDGSLSLSHKVLCKQNNNLHAKCAMYYWKTPKLNHFIQFWIKCALGWAAFQCAHTLYDHMGDLLPLTHYGRWAKLPSKTRNGWFLKNSIQSVSLCRVSRPS